MFAPTFSLPIENVWEIDKIEDIIIIPKMQQQYKVIFKAEYILSAVHDTCIVYYFKQLTLQDIWHNVWW